MECSRTKVIGRFLKSIVLPLLLLGWLASPSPVSAATGIVVSVDAPAAATVGSDFIVKVNIDNVKNLDAIVFRVRFDPSIVDLPTTDADSNGIYDSIVNGEVGGKTVQVLATAWKEPGLIGIIGEVEPFLSGTSGSGYLAELHFHALSPGTSNIGLEHNSLSNINAESLEAEWTDSTVKVYAGSVPPLANININWPLVGGAIIAVAVIVVGVLLVRRTRLG